MREPDGLFVVKFNCYEKPSYRTFGYFINEVLSESIEDIFYDINKVIIEEDHVDLPHLYVDSSKFEANANKYTRVWRKATEKSRYRLFAKVTTLIEQINETLSYAGIKMQSKNTVARLTLAGAGKTYACLGSSKVIRAC